MKKQEIKKIEDKLSDIEVPDSVLNLARAEMSQTDKVQNPARRKLNFKIALSCAASFVLCLAIILPITLSSFDNKGNYTQPPDSADSSPSPSDDLPQNAPSAEASPLYKLQELDMVQVYPDISDSAPLPGDPDAQLPDDRVPVIKYLSHIKYSSYGEEIMSLETYSVYDGECTVYTLYNVDIRVDVLEVYKNFEGQYVIGTVKVNYKITDGNYLAEAYYNDCRYCFAGDFSEKSVFEEFCQYLFQEN